ncbi:hypothetical protein E8E78_15970 [Pseudomonas sp. BN505]|nr:hypothetical protein [Pseudomonas sp. BN605]MDH4858076.1 hypothetical protein [Pseudomonas sp. BN505]
MGLMLHPAPCLGWVGSGADSQVHFLGRIWPHRRQASAHRTGAGLEADASLVGAGLPAMRPVQVPHQWNMNRVSLANCASNWCAGIGRPNR